jgi:uncharacterized membrane protein YfcA
MRLWFPILVPPLVTLAQQSVNYALVALECEQQQRFPIHAVAAVALLAALAGVGIAWRHWKRAGVAAPEDSGDQRSRTRFLAIVGISVSALMALAIAAQWLTVAFIPPCLE